jgi:hypothetical protein
MRTLLLGLVVCAGLQADILQLTYIFGAGASPCFGIACQTPKATQKIDLFPTADGTLNSVDIQTDVKADVGWGAADPGGFPGTKVRWTDTVSFLISGSLFNSGSQVIGGTYTSLGQFRQIDGYPFVTSAQFNFDTKPNDLFAWQGTGSNPITLTENTASCCFGSLQFPDGFPPAGFGIADFPTLVSATVTVTYDYTPIPEPHFGPVVLLSFVIIAVFVRRHHRHEKKKEG